MALTSDAQLTAIDVPSTRMLAVTQRRYGDIEVLALDEIAVPQPGDGEVLVRVHAAGIDRGTWHVMTGTPYVARLALGMRRPRVQVPGLDLAGVVVATGPGASRFRPGDEVFGIGKGSFAPYTVASEEKLAHKPVNVPFHQAAAVPVSGLTALHAVADAGGLQRGQRVLILGASGGVGSYAVQIAKSIGAHVTGVCSAGKVDFVRSLGADKVLDYARDDVLATSSGYDLIVDIGGNRSLTSLRRALGRKGTLVIVGAEGGGKILGIGRQLRAVALSPFVPQRLKMLVPNENRADLERLAAMLADGRIVPAVDRTFPLAETATAMRELVSGHISGKAVITNHV